MKKNPNAWMTTFSDMTTLMLTFFVMLISMSSFDVEKIRTYANSVKDALISSTGGEGVFKEGGGFVFVSFKEALKEARKGAVGQILAQLTKDIEVIQKEGTWTIRIPGKILFPYNSAEINPSAFPYLSKIADLLWRLPGEIRIEGHTDSLENDKFLLSIKRAANVLHFFLGTKKLSPQRFSIIGYGDIKPLPQKNKENRRVEIIVEKRG